MHSTVSEAAPAAVAVHHQMPERALEKVRTASLSTETGSRRGMAGCGDGDMGCGVDLGKEMETEMQVQELGVIGVAKTTGF